MPDYLTCIMNSEAPEKSIADYLGVLEESGYRGRVKIAFDEWNLRSWHHPGFPRKEVQDYSNPEVTRLVGAREERHRIPIHHGRRVVLSVVPQCLLRHAEDVGMANIAPTVNTRGPLLFIRRESSGAPISTPWRCMPTCFSRESATCQSRRTHWFMAANP